MNFLTSWLADEANEADSFMHEAVLYDKLENGQVRCKLCAHRCRVADGKRGICAVRENNSGTLYSLVYGRAISANVDPIEKKPLFHFLPGTRSYSIATAGCNFSCVFCQNWQISQITKGPRGQIVGEDLPPDKIVERAMKLGCQSISYTYTEPTIFFEYAYDTARLAQKAGLKNIFVTNGYQTPETIEQMVGVIDAVNVDLKSFSDEYYRSLCGGRLAPVLDSIKLMYKRGIWVEVTTLIVPDQNDSQEEITQIAEYLCGISRDIPWHISRFYPQYRMDESCPTTLETLYRAYELGKKAGLNYIYVGNVPGNEYENTYCPGCGEKVIGRFSYSVEKYLQGEKCPKCGEKMPFVL